jgi:hypothetical protein
VTPTATAPSWQASLPAPAPADKRYAGVAPLAHVLDVRVAADDGSTDLTTVLKGLALAKAHGADVVNLSLSSGSNLPHHIDPLTLALDRLWADGIVVVVPTGNDGPSRASVTSPGSDPMLLTVGALDEKLTSTTEDDDVPAFSGRGPAPMGVAKPDLVAPGQSLVSVRAVGSVVDRENPHAVVQERYFRGSGTSFATAAVAGTAALMLKAQPTLTPDQVKAMVRGTAYSAKGLSDVRGRRQGRPRRRRRPGGCRTGRAQRGGRRPARRGRGRVARLPRGPARRRQEGRRRCLEAALPRGPPLGREQLVRPPLGREQLVRSPLGRPPLGGRGGQRRRVGDALLGRAPLGRSPLGGRRVGRAPLGRPPLGRPPLGGGGLVRAPLGRPPLGGGGLVRAPLGGPPLGRAPLGGAPLGREPVGLTADPERSPSTHERVKARPRIVPMPLSPLGERGIGVPEAGGAT